MKSIRSARQCLCVPLRSSAELSETTSERQPIQQLWPQCVAWRLTYGAVPAGPEIKLLPRWYSCPWRLGAALRRFIVLCSRQPSARGAKTPRRVHGWRLLPTVGRAFCINLALHVAQDQKSIFRAKRKWKTPGVRPLSLGSSVHENAARCKTQASPGQLFWHFDTMVGVFFVCVWQEESTPLLGQLGSSET